MHDQQETLKVLDMALSVLSQVYKKGSLVQQTLTGPSPPKGFDEYKQNEVSKSVKALLWRNDPTWFSAFFWTSMMQGSCSPFQEHDLSSIPSFVAVSL